MIGNTISHYKILEKLGEARIHRLYKKLYSIFTKIKSYFYKKYIVTPGKGGLSAVAP
jgi:hypothetical protein